ncbi:hypothetical protein G6F60_013267 [Rhizopus arrhizus]|nr:hypothetical protein G6F60_013267 [Rhizopus arrhizus]
MLKLCEDHSLSLGYRWNPLKCAVLNHPTSSSSSSGSTQLSLYGTPLPLVDKFVYLGMPFVKTGLSAASALPLRSPGVLQLMGILNKIGVNRQGFSLLLCARIYATFVRPKFEYGLAISKFTAAQTKEIERLQDRCLRMMVGGHATSSTLVIKHMTTLPSMHHRIDVLTTRFCLRARCLPASCLLSLLSRTLSVSRIKVHLDKNPLFLALPSPPPSSDARLKTFFRQYRERQVISLVTSTTQNALSWFVGVLAGCQVNPKIVLVDVIVALVVTFLSATLYHRSFGPTFLAILLGLTQSTLLFPRCLLVAQLAVLLGGRLFF